MIDKYCGKVIMKVMISGERGVKMGPREVIGRIHKLELVRKLQHRKETEEFKLYFGQMPVLDFVSNHPGCTQVEIAEFLQVSPASIALSTKRLQKAGYITKEVDPDNLRCKRLMLTESGERARRLSHERLDEMDKRMFEGFSEEEMVTLTMLLDRATMNLTGETVNIVSGEVFHNLHKQLETLEHEKKAETK